MTRRLLATVRCDARLQARNGFYLAAAVMVGLWVLLAARLPTDLVDVGWLLPAVVGGNLVMSTFYFVGGLVLLEKAEGTLHAQVVTPLRPGEYLAAKLLTLTVLALVENVVLVLALAGPGVAPAPLLLGTAVAAALYVLSGFVLVARYDSINEYLLPSVLYASALELPLAAYLAGWEAWPLYLHPFQPPLVLLRAAFAPAAPWELAYGVLASAAWLGLAAAWASRSFRRFVVERAGGG